MPSQQAAPVVEAPAQVPVERFSRDQKLFAIVGLGFLILIAMLFSVMSDRNQLKSKVDKLSGSSSTSQVQADKATVAEVGKYLELPTDETPIVATVGDVEKARGQSPEFFAKAANGDKVLLYSKAKEAILYRPSTKKIIVVAPFSSGTAPSVNSGTSTTTEAK
jgi:hypothetical protein